MDSPARNDAKIPAGQRRMRARVTMHDVARMAEVSASTVSLYLRAPAEVSQARAARIRVAIDRLGYVPNRMAGALSSAQSRVVGVIVPSIVNSFFAATVGALQARLQAANYQILIGHTDYDEAAEIDLVRTFLSWSPGAMVLTGLDHPRPVRRMLEAGEMPVVEMWELGPRPIDMAVGFSHGEVGRMQAAHLIGQGARSIAFIGARLDRDRRAAERAEGYAQAVASHPGLAAPEIVDAGSEASTASAARAFAALIARRPEIDGVVFSNDLLALGALFEAQRQGVAVPGRVAMIGFGDLDFASGAVPRLSTIRPPRAEIGATVADLVLARLEDRDAAPGQARGVDLGVVLEARESSLRQGQDSETKYS